MNSHTFNACFSTYFHQFFGKFTNFFLAQCNSGCVNGHCVAPNTCTCNPGYRGVDCSISECKHLQLILTILNFQIDCFYISVSTKLGFKELTETFLNQYLIDIEIFYILISLEVSWPLVKGLPFSRLKGKFWQLFSPLNGTIRTNILHEQIKDRAMKAITYYQISVLQGHWGARSIYY